MESIVVIGAIVLLFLANRFEWLEPILSMLGKKKPLEPDAEPNEQTPVLDALEELVKDLNLPMGAGVLVAIRLLKRAIKNNPKQAPMLIQTYVPMIQEELVKAKEAQEQQSSNA